MARRGIRRTAVTRDRGDDNVDKTPAQPSVRSRRGRPPASAKTAATETQVTVQIPAKRTRRGVVTRATKAHQVEEEDQTDEEEEEEEEGEEDVIATVTKTQSKTVIKDGEFEYTPTRPTRGKAHAKNKKRIVGKTLSLDAVRVPVEETGTYEEGDNMDVDVDEPAEQSGKEAAETADPSTQDNIASSAMQVKPNSSNSNSRMSSITRAEPFIPRHTSIGSDIERGSEHLLHQRLDEMTRKCENLETKYKHLRDVGVKEAEENFLRIQRQTEEQTQASNRAIAALKRDLAIQTSLVSKTSEFKTRAVEQQTQISNLTKQVSILKASLSESRSDNKGLQAKLQASRVSSLPAETRVPGSAVKTNAAARNGISIDAQSKEDLYSDLTGLIVCNIKRTNDTLVYDCLQTGRHGTLHFRLTVPESTSSSYTESEVQYTPLIDTDRDGDLLGVLPDYLTEEITFQRTHAAKFYNRLMKALSDHKVVNIEKEDEEEEEGADGEDGEDEDA